MKITCEIVHKCGLPNYSSVSVGLSVTKDIDESKTSPQIEVQSLFRGIEAQIEKEMKVMKTKLS